MSSLELLLQLQYICKYNLHVCVADCAGSSGDSAMNLVNKKRRRGDLNSVLKRLQEKQSPMPPPPHENSTKTMPTQVILINSDIKKGINVYL